jgi:hypothetical protein
MHLRSSFQRPGKAVPLRIPWCSASSFSLESLQTYVDEMIGRMFLSSFSSAAWWVGGSSADAQKYFKPLQLKPGADEQQHL